MGKILLLVLWSVESVKKQLLLGAIACVAATLVFGGLLSLAVNLSLEQLKNRQDIVIPGAPGGANDPGPLQ